MKGDELELEKKLLPKMKILAELYGLKAEARIKIWNDFTYDYEKSSYVFGFAEGDIVIYDEITIDKIAKQFKLYRYTLKGKLFIPYIILELKSGKVTVDSIRARNKVAQKLKQAYPYCSYIFIAENTSKQKITVYRHGYNFSNSFIFNSFLRSEDMDKISHFIRNHLNEVINNK